MLETVKEERIEELKEAFIEDELSEEDFDTLLDAAMENGPPFRADWFMRQPESRRKRYAQEDIYTYFDEEYKVEGDLVVRANSEDIDRTISVRDRELPPEEVEYTYREDQEISEEVKEKQDKLKEAILG